MRLVSFLLFICLVMAGCNSKRGDEASSFSSSKPVFEINGFTFAIEIPDNWSTIEDADSLNAVAFREQCPDDKTFCANLVVRTMPNDSLLHLDDIANIYRYELESTYAQMEVVAVSDAVIGGLDSKVIDYKLFENQTNLGSTTVFMVKGSTIVGFYFAAENASDGGYLEQRKVFAEMLNSLEL
ncbi:MAG: hypothetical protein DIU61_004000 [Bacteroidota bacterium]|jgi:hypothetical protein